MGGRTVLVAVASVDQGRMPEPRGETEAADRGEMEAAIAGAGAILEAARSLVGRRGEKGGKGCGQGQSTERRRAGAGGFRARAQGPAAAGVPTEEEKIRKKIVPARSGGGNTYRPIGRDRTPRRGRPSWRWRPRRPARWRGGGP